MKKRGAKPAGQHHRVGEGVYDDDEHGQNVKTTAAEVLEARQLRQPKRRGLTPLLRVLMLVSSAVAPVVISRGLRGSLPLPSSEVVHGALGVLTQGLVEALGSGWWAPATAQPTGAVDTPPSRRAPLARAAQSKLADTELEEWRVKLLEHSAALPEYPEGRFNGRGIVMSAGRRSYFTSAYVTIRALRSHHNCTLPIEVFYNGAAELPDTAIRHMEQAYRVKFVDVTAMAEAKGVDLRGYQLKAFAIQLSSFEEVLWLDSDNIPLTDPSFLFEAEQYVANGALFWQDFCNMISFRKETFGVFGLAEPLEYQQPRPNKTTIWQNECLETIETELETGQVLLHKRKAWAALQMIVFINRHHDFFLKRLFKGDKMTFHFGFKAAGQAYGLVSHVPGSIGLAADHFGDKQWFCGNTMAQRHPTDGSILFLHRTMSKYKDAESYTKRKGVYRAWKFYALQPPRDPWQLMYRDELPAALFVGTNTGDQYECARPTGSKVGLERTPGSVTKLETSLLRYLGDLENLPFYPKDRVCNADSMFFCANA